MVGKQYVLYRYTQQAFSLVKAEQASMLGVQGLTTAESFGQWNVSLSLTLT